MATRAEITTGHFPKPMPTGRTAKFLSDVLTILEMKILLMRRGCYWYLLSSVVFPVGMFYWARGIAPDDPEAVRRVMTGAIIFGTSLGTVGTLAQQMIQARFQGKLKLMVTMPMSKSAYAIGVLSFASMLAAATVTVLLAFAWIADVDFTLNWAFFPLAAMLLLSMAGLPPIHRQLCPLGGGRRYHDQPLRHTAVHGVTGVLHHGAGSPGTEVDWLGVAGEVCRRRDCEVLLRTDRYLGRARCPVWIRANHDGAWSLEAALERTIIKRGLGVGEAQVWA